MKGSLLSTALLSCAVFSSLTLPLAVFGSKVVEINFQKEPLFSGQLRDISAPYLGAAGLISLGAGAVSLSVAGWRSSSRKSSEIAGRLSELQDELKTKQTQIEEFQLSESHLKAAGLKDFLGENVIQTLEAARSIEPVDTSVEETCATSSVSVTPLYIPPVVMPKAEQPRKIVAAPAVQPVEVVRPVVVQNSAPQESAPVRSEIAAASQIEELQSQLQQMAAQFEKLQAVLQTPQVQVAQAQVAQAQAPLVEVPQAQAPLVEAPKAEVLRLVTPKVAAPAVEAPKVELPLVEPAPARPLQVAHSKVSDPSMIEHLHRRLQQLESEWVRQKVAL